MATQVWGYDWRTQKMVVQPAGWTYNMWVQSGLNYLLGLKLTVDGVIGSATKAAIKQFQAKYGLTADGIWGPLSAAMMLKWYRIAPPGEAVTEPTTGGGESEIPITPFITPYGSQLKEPQTQYTQESWLSRNWLTVGIAAVGVLFVGSMYVWYAQNKKTKTKTSRRAEAFPS
jgi:peptidoglycan hydrolase-like protein with peptidoglycan-binding domain